MAPAVKEKHLFRLAYGVLALAFWVSVAGFTYLMTRPNRSHETPWSTWKPKEDNLAGARQIAHYVARRYKLDDGKQLAAVQEHPPVVQGLNLEAIGIRRLTNSGSIDPYIALYQGPGTVMYAFCGLGTNCSIPGETSEARDRLLRREALELALYSFKYLDGVETVVSLLPPASSQDAATAVLLRKGWLDDLLDRPLRSVLPASTPPAPSELGGAEASVIDKLTQRRTFPAAFEALPDGDAILVLKYDGS